MTKTKNKKRDGRTMPKNDARNAKAANRYAEIQDAYDERTKDGSRRYKQVDLAKKFGLSQGRVSQIVRNPNAIFYDE